jgi:hypothetical protein
MDNRRKIVLINPSFQFGMIVKFIALNIVLLALFSGLVYFFLDSEITANLQKAHATYKSVRDMLLPVVMVLSILTIVISSIIIALFVLMASFRIAGPLFRFNAVVSDLAARKFTTATMLRKHDQLYQCSITIQQMVQIISGDLAEIKAKAGELQALCEEGRDWEKAAGQVKAISEIIGRYTI